jgi:AraC-like DNA-binding protein
MLQDAEAQSELLLWLKKQKFRGRMEWVTEEKTCPSIVSESFRWGEPYLDWQDDDRLCLAVALSMNQSMTGGVVLYDLQVSELSSAEELESLRKLGNCLQAWLEEYNLVNAALMKERRLRQYHDRRQAEGIHAWKQESADTLRRNFGQLEPELVLAIRRDDRAEARRILNALLLRLYNLGHENLDRIKDLMAELIYLMRHTARECGATEAVSPILLEPVGNMLDRIGDEEDLSPWLHRQLEGILDAISAVSVAPSALRARKVVAYIQENCMRSLSRAEVAGKAGLSEAEFSRMVKKETGKSFTTHLTEARVTVAMDLLRTSGLTVQEVGYRSGFESPPHFSRTFKQMAGVSPMEFRKRGGVQDSQ